MLERATSAEDWPPTKGRARFEVEAGVRVRMTAGGTVPCKAGEPTVVALRRRGRTAWRTPRVVASVPIKVLLKVERDVASRGMGGHGSKWAVKGKQLITPDSRSERAWPPEELTKGSPAERNGKRILRAELKVWEKIGMLSACEMVFVQHTKRHIPERHVMGVSHL